MSDPEIQKLDDHELEIQSTDQDNYPYTKIRGNLRWTGTAWERWTGLTTTPLVDGEYDYIGFGYPDADTDVLTFKTGGAGGTTVSTITIDYTDATKEDISAITKT